MKKIFLCFMLCFFCLTSVSYAAYDFGFFTIDVPGDWDVIDKTKDTVVIGAPDKKLSFSIMRLPLNGATTKQAAEDIAKEYKGTKPVQLDNRESYDFTMVANGVDSYCQVWLLDGDKDVAVVFIFGDHDSAQANKILESIEYK